MGRRAHGTGSLLTKTSSSGVETWYGQWRVDGRLVKRRIGPRGGAGGGGLSKKEAERELRRLIDASEREPRLEAVDMAEAGRRWIAHLKLVGRKRSTLTDYESAIRVHFVPVFGGTPLLATPRPRPGRRPPVAASGGGGGGAAGLPASSGRLGPLDGSIWTMESTSTPRGKRADAVRNHGRVVAAAREVFAEHGVDVCIDVIAARAGVGKATVYRSFPTKEHLIAAVATERLRGFERLASAALVEVDAGQAFRRVIVTIAEANASNRIMLEALRLEGDVGGLDNARAAAAGALGELLRAAKRAGAVRRDVTYEDVRVLLSGLPHALTASQRSDPAVWRRYANMIVDALAPGGR